VWNVNFFFQADDGIRDFHVTGVQTCALPIFALQQRDPIAFDERVDDGSRTGLVLAQPAMAVVDEDRLAFDPVAHGPAATAALARSEERRVGKECSSTGVPDHSINKCDNSVYF